jgi:Tfp pilus assembly protein PilV
VKVNGKGVLLIESLLAVTILSVGIVALLQAVQVSLRAGAAAGERYRASLAVEGRAWELGYTHASAAPSVEVQDPVLGPVTLTVAGGAPAAPAQAPGAADAAPGWTVCQVTAGWTAHGRAQDLSLPVPEIQ